ncbi:hypothetical protein [Aquamicrobium sp. LC103]|uniref:hypothetical protein n=1 Tax=Aquamicrobium sp. LC103 TaxID=1120658 RepID=UPI00063E70E6|nr:hypothetical protein [Aquamicrobium sp. LC103]TKT80031.1 hypothetical protein XW59_006630 [Aquamicrobium sp. LC103]
MKLTRRHLTVLEFLSAIEGWCAPARLPDGNRRHVGASAHTLTELKRLGFIEYGKEPAHSLYGYRITDAGRAALESDNGKGGK